MKKKLRILLTGASGSIGKEVARLLVQQADSLDLTFFDLDKRAVRRRLHGYGTKVKLLYGDIRHEKDIVSACRNQDVVFHLAALLPPKAYDRPEEAKATNFLGTTNLIKGLEQYSPNCFFIYTSSIAVYGDRLKDFWINVGDQLRPAPGDVYAETKIAAEHSIRASKLRWSIFRLTAIMGDHKPSGLMFYQPLVTKMEIATIADASRALVLALNHLTTLEGKVYNLGGGASCRVQYDDFLRRSFKVLGLKTANFPTKAFAEKNFHCGYYQDSDQLEEILHFRSDTLEDYWRQEAAKVGPLARMFLPLIRGLVKTWLLSLSKPYKAWKAKDREEMQKFYEI